MSITAEQYKTEPTARSWVGTCSLLLATKAHKCSEYTVTLARSETDK